MRILIIEDEIDLAEALRRAFVEEGFACDVSSEGEDGLFKALTWEYDAVLLDLMLPGLDGPTILSRLRERRRTPVLVLTARDAVEDKVGLLDSGADDYVSKPFELTELIARVRSLIRRSTHEPSPLVRLPSCEIDTARRVVRRRGRDVRLSPKEFALLEYLALHRGTVVSRATLHEHLYDEDDESISNVLEVYVSNIRRKLGRDAISTRRGEGYTIDVE